MDNFTKMSLVPYQDPLRNQQPDAPLLNQMATLDAQMGTILKDNTLNPELKHQKYMQTLKRYQALNSQQIPTTKFPDEEPKIDENVLDAIPKQFKTKGRLLIQHVNKHPDIFNWTPDGKLKYQGMPIDGSNAMDLVHDFSRNKGPLSAPAIGSKQFARLLKETNVPKVAIGNPTRMEEPLLSNSRFSALLDEEESDNNEYSTPERHGRLDESWLANTSFGIPMEGTPPVSRSKKKKERKKMSAKKFDEQLASFEPMGPGRYPTRERKPVKRFDPVTGHGYVEKYDPIKGYGYKWYSYE